MFLKVFYKSTNVETYKESLKNLFIYIFRNNNFIFTKNNTTFSVYIYVNNCYEKFYNTVRARIKLHKKKYNVVVESFSYEKVENLNEEIYDEIICFENNTILQEFTSSAKRNETTMVNNDNNNNECHHRLLYTISEEQTTEYLHNNMIISEEQNNMNYINENFTHMSSLTSSSRRTLQSEINQSIIDGASSILFGTLFFPEYQFTEQKKDYRTIIILNIDTETSHLSCLNKEYYNNIETRQNVLKEKINDHFDEIINFLKKEIFEGDFKRDFDIRVGISTLCINCNNVRTLLDMLKVAVIKDVIENERNVERENLIENLSIFLKRGSVIVNFDELDGIINNYFYINYFVEDYLKFQNKNLKDSYENTKNSSNSWTEKALAYIYNNLMNKFKFKNETRLSLEEIIDLKKATESFTNLFTNENNSLTFSYTITKKFKLLQDFEKIVKYPNHVQKVDYRHELHGKDFLKYIKDNIVKFCCNRNESENYLVDCNTGIFDNSIAKKIDRMISDCNFIQRENYELYIKIRDIKIILSVYNNTISIKNVDYEKEDPMYHNDYGILDVYYVQNILKKIKNTLKKRNAYECLETKNDFKAFLIAEGKEIFYDTKPFEQHMYNGIKFLDINESICINDTEDFDENLHENENLIYQEEDIINAQNIKILKLEDDVYLLKKTKRETEEELRETKIKFKETVERLENEIKEVKLQLQNEIEKNKGIKTKIKNFKESIITNESSIIDSSETINVSKKKKTVHYADQQQKEPLDLFKNYL